MIFAVAALVAALTAGIGTLAMRAIARKYNIADHPSERRINTKPVPRAGGLAVAGAFALIGSLLIIFSVQLGLSAGSGSAELTSAGAAALLLGTVIAGVIGLIDDRYDLRARWQIIGQFLIALIPIAFGLRIAFISNPLGAARSPVRGWVCASPTRSAPPAFRSPAKA
jgi:UDP-GlcNAc:undecaprenyl-phosphate GlcNAc-1-phosphate transferase